MLPRRDSDELLVRTLIYRQDLQAKKKQLTEEAKKPKLVQARHWEAEEEEEELEDEEDDEGGEEGGAGVDASAKGKGKGKQADLGAEQRGETLETEARKWVSPNFSYLARYNNTLETFR